MCCGKLLIKAISVEDSDLISSLVQDSILHIAHHSFHAEQNCFRLMLNRFCWEEMDTFNRHECYFRVHSGLYIHNVNSIVANDNMMENAEQFLNLLTMHVSENEVNLAFSEKKHLCINVDFITIYMKDLYDKYPTISCPIHSQVL